MVGREIFILEITGSNPVPSTLQQLPIKIMNDILAALQNYYATHSKAEILEDQDSTKEFDEIGVTVENYLILDHIQFVKHN